MDLEGRRVVVVGGGEEATRKVRLLLKTPARIEVIAATLHPELAGNPRIYHVATAFGAALLDGAALVYSADPALNATVSAAAQARGIPVNAVDDAAISTFLVPSIVDRDPVVVAIGTEGTAPVLGQGVRAHIDALLPPTLGALAARAATLRATVAKIVPHGNRRRGFWQRFFFGDVREAHESGDAVAFELALQDALFLEAKPSVGRVSFVATGADVELLTLKAQRRLQEADVIVHATGAVPAVLEMARRDAVRIAADGRTALAAVAAEAAKGLHVVRIVNEAATAQIEKARLAEAGLAVETIPTLAALPVADPTETPFPDRDDLRDALLRAAS
ncbi:MAG: NAD(P)-dependent oxidoreductase [Hyphomicrobiales bacterium]